MYKRDFVKEVARVLRRDKAKKTVKINKRNFYISDDYGNTKQFSVKSSDKHVPYTIEDITIILNACLDVIQDILKRNDSVTFPGFGTFSLKLRKGREVKNGFQGVTYIVPDHYYPKFSIGKDLKMCAKIYEMMQDEQNVLPDQIFDRIYEPDPIDEGGEDQE